LLLTTITNIITVTVKYKKTRTTGIQCYKTIYFNQPQKNVCFHVCLPNFPSQR